MAHGAGRPTRGEDPLVSPAAPVPSRRVWRGFLVGLALLPANSLWVFYMEPVSGRGPYISTISLFFNVIFIISLVALGNALVRRLRPSLALNRAELILVYIILQVGTSIMGHDMLQVLIPVMTVGYWFANPQNRWESILDGATPSWLVLSDKEVLYRYYNGSSSLYQGPILLAWLTPIAWWTGFIVVLVFVMICLSVVLRPLWAERERLTFPIIQLPLELTDPATSLLRSRLMWVGFAIAGGIDLLNGLNYLNPAIPSIPMNVDLMRWIPDMPWAGIGWLPVTFQPAVIGLSFLMPLDLLFSCCFFFFWWKALYIVAAATGVSRGYGGGISESIFPYTNEQMFGGFIAIALGSILLGRRYFRYVGRRVMGRPSEVDDSQEGMPFRLAVLGALLGIGLLVAFSLRAGMSLGIATLVFVIYYLLAIAVARVRAEFGSPVHDFHFTGPDYTIAYVAGTMNLRAQDLGMLTQYFWFNRAYRGHPIADSIEGLQIAARSRSSSRVVVVALVVATFAAAVAGFWIWLHYAYRIGATQFGGSEWFGREAYERLQSWSENPKQANFIAPIAMAAGFAITLLLASARTAFVGWPLHPVAYALSASWSIHLVWMPMLIAWTVKSAVLRYGGLRYYRQVLPLFYGLILGESIVGCAWPLIGLIFRVPSYNFFGS
jgi:hypothetical protein